MKYLEATSLLFLR